MRFEVAACYLVFANVVYVYTADGFLQCAPSGLQLWVFGDVEM
jgi:hypothetical protein